MMISNPRIIIISIKIIGVFLLAGCDDYTQRQLTNENFVKTVAAQPSRRVEPLPYLKPRVKSPQLLLRKDLFMPIDQRQHKIRNSSVCYTPIERGYNFVYQDRSIDDLVFVRYRKSETSFSVTLWDGKELQVLHKNTLLGKGQWQLSAVDRQGVTLAQLDQCSRVKVTKISKF